MILLDTNVVSEPLKLAGHPAVLAWLDAQLIETLCLSTISLAELRFGIAALPDGKRKDTLHNSLEKRILPLFAGRILFFDEATSKAYGELRALAKAQGKAIAPAVGYIAATAICNSLMVATRDTDPFEAAGLQVIILGFRLSDSTAPTLFPASSYSPAGGSSIPARKSSRAVLPVTT